MNATPKSLTRVLGVSTLPGYGTVNHLFDGRGTLCGAMLYSWTGAQYDQVYVPLCPLCAVCKITCARIGGGLIWGAEEMASLRQAIREYVDAYNRAQEAENTHDKLVEAQQSAWVEVTRIASEQGVDEADLMASIDAAYMHPSPTPPEAE